MTTSFSFSKYHRELYEERAAILEYDAGLERKDAELQAYKEVLLEYRLSINKDGK